MMNEVNHFIYSFFTLWALLFFGVIQALTLEYIKIHINLLEHFYYKKPFTAFAQLISMSCVHLTRIWILSKISPEILLT